MIIAFNTSSFQQHQRMLGHFVYSREKNICGTHSPYGLFDLCPEC